MEIITYPIETEVDATRIAALFDERKIPYTIKKHSDLFPYNGDRRPFAELLVLREFQKEAQAILDEAGSSSKVDFQGEEDLQVASGDSDLIKPKQRNFWRPILILYSLVVTVLLIRYWDINRKTSDTKNFSYAWNASNTELITRYKKDQQLIEIFTDANYDLNFEKTETYSNNVLTARANDYNEDGFFDEVTYFGRNGKVSGSTTDYNSDGQFEESVIILETGDTMKLTDKNHDGFFILEKR